MNFKKFFRLILVVILATTLFDVASGQVNLQQVGRYQYAQYNGTWYTIFDGKQGDLVDTQHLIVRLKNKSDIDRFDFVSLALPRLVNIRGEFAAGFYELEIPEESNGFEVARKLEGTGKFDEVLFNVFLEVDAVPNDQYYGSQWNLPKISSPYAWDLNTGSSTIIVAVIDVGADYNHEDLIGNLWSGIGYDFYDNDPDPYPDDEARHGTAVAGILGALTNNGIGVSGVAGGWGGVGGIRIMHLDAGHRTFINGQWKELISLSAATQATDYAAMNGAGVINMSFGGGPYSPLQDAINNAVNTIVIASAGNYQQGQSTNVIYPAAYGNVIAVGATTPSDIRKKLNDGTENWWGSSYGSELDVMAPGVYIWTTDLTGSIGYSSGNYYGSFNGTSSAAPQVVGLAALILSINPSLTLLEVRDIIRNSADKVPDMDGQNFHIEYGYGRINVLRSVVNAFILANPQYTFTDDSAPLIFYDSNYAIEFLADPRPDLSAGHYLVDRYYVDATIGGFVSEPQGWYTTPYGFDWENPNSANRYLLKETTSSSVHFQTVFYFITWDIFGNQINKWAPFNPNPSNLRKYGVLGIPLVPPIIANFTQDPNPICKGSSGYVYSHLSQGNGDLQYTLGSFEQTSRSYCYSRGKPL